MSINDFLSMDLLPVFVILGAVLIIIIPIAAAKGKKINNEIYEETYGDNDNSEKIIEYNARIIARRSAPHPMSPTLMVNNVLFELSNGKRIELAIKDNDTFSIMLENDCGTLTYQGKKFISFERN